MNYKVAMADGEIKSIIDDIRTIQKKIDDTMAGIDELAMEYNGTKKELLMAIRNAIDYDILQEALMVI